ncbi:MAG: HutD family protein [Chitinophagaceae bacterium]|nr:HutD family protein [Chitinophagaceae bacterium]
MKIRHIRKERIQPGAWQGGQTFQLCISPESANYQNKDFEFRISTATIEVCPSAFTKFSGYNRYIVMLDNDLRIERNGKREHYERMSLFTFDSSDTIVSFSTGQDFNFMIRKGLAVPAFHIGPLHTAMDHLQGLVFAPERISIEVSDKTYELDPYDCLFVGKVNQEAILLNCSSDVIFGYW